MPKAGIVPAIIRKVKASGSSFFGNEYTTSRKGWGGYEITAINRQEDTKKAY